MISLMGGGEADYKFGKKFFCHFFRVKAVHCQYKDEYSFTFCGFYQVKHSDPVSVILSDRVQYQRKGRYHERCVGVPEKETCNLRKTY